MIVGVRGVLEATGSDWVQLRVGGVTLEVFVPAATVSGLGQMGGEIHLFTDLRLRDDQPVLYGFPSAEARGLFLMLMTVSGIGPRIALSLLSGLGPQGVNNAIANEDVATLSTVRGVGRRIAGRIILELKGKLEVDQSAVISASAGDDAEVVSALMALGYSTAEARRAVAAVDRSPEVTLEDRVRLALQQFG